MKYRLILAVCASLALPVATASANSGRAASVAPIGGATQDTNCRAAPHGSGILTDGDFSQAPDPGSWQGIVRGTAFAPSWAVSRRTIDFYGRTGAWPVPGGLCSVDLDGSGPKGVGGIEHSAVATTIGTKYTICFLFSGNRHCAAYQRGPAIKTLLVEAAGLRGTLAQVFYWNTAGGHDAEHGDFDDVTWTFIAVDSTTQVSFTSLDRPATSNCGPVVAAVSLN